MTTTPEPEDKSAAAREAETVAQPAQREPRFARNETLFLQVQRGAVDLEGLVLHCNTRDISRNGFNVKADNPIALGVILELLMELPEHQQPFLLTAEVRWCKPLEAKGFSVGFVILDAMHSDYVAWREALDGAASAPHDAMDANKDVNHQKEQ